MDTKETSRLTNRHIAKLLCDLEALCPEMPSLAKVAVKREMRFLVSDVINVTKGNESDTTPHAGWVG